MDRIYNIREEYKRGKLSVKNIPRSPFELFTKWFQEVCSNKLAEPNAMVLSTVGKDMMPSSRIVLLKVYDMSGFTFFTNYESRKAAEINENPQACLLFPWHEMERQVRVEGEIIRVSDDESDEYFNTRPVNSRIGAWASPQSKIIPSRKYLEELERSLKKQFRQKKIPRPPQWGGYKLIANTMEFWQGRESRLHDRIEYRKVNSQWSIQRLAP